MSNKTPFKNHLLFHLVKEQFTRIATFLEMLQNNKKMRNRFYYYLAFIRAERFETHGF